MVAVLRLLILANFNPRSLTGTTFWMAALALISLFQSTLPCRSDIDARGGTRYTEISIHAPLRERQFGRTATSVAHVFQSTLPYGSDQCQQGNTA